MEGGGWWLGEAVSYVRIKGNSWAISMNLRFIPTARFTLSGLMLMTLVLSVTFGAAAWGLRENAKLLAALPLVVGIPAAAGALADRSQGILRGVWVGLLLLVGVCTVLAVFNGVTGVRY